MIYYKETNLLDSREYLFSNIQEHSDEVATPNNPSKVTLDCNQIIELENDNCLVSIKAVKDDSPVGLISGYVYPHMHHKDVLFATTTIIMVSKELGKERIKVFKGLVSEFESLVYSRYKAEYIQIAISAYKDNRNLVRRLGYTDTDYILTKKIGN